MHCQNCGNPAVAGDGFCGYCGAPLARTAPPPQVTPGWVATPASPPAAAPPPPTGASTGLIVTLSVIGVVVLAGLGVGGYLMVKALQGADPPRAGVVATATPTATPDAKATAVRGFPTAQEAVEDVLPSGWVYDVLRDNEDSIEYVMGPPNSEYTDVFVVEKQADGSWLVTDSHAFEAGGSDEAGSQSTALSPEDEARQVVGEFLYAVKQDRANDAHALTIPPFSDDPASAQYSNGDLKSIEVVSAQLQSDNTTVRVRSRETWAWGTEEWIYVCVPTDAGYRITRLVEP